MVKSFTVLRNTAGEGSFSPLVELLLVTTPSLKLWSFSFELTFLV